MLVTAAPVRYSNTGAACATARLTSERYHTPNWNQRHDTTRHDTHTRKKKHVVAVSAIGQEEHRRCSNVCWVADNVTTNILCLLHATYHIKTVC